MAVPELNPTRVRKIAVNQRKMLICIGLMVMLAIVGAFIQLAVSQGGDPDSSPTMWHVYVYYIINFFAFYYAVLLAANAYNSVILGIVIGLFCLIPCFGILVLLGLNQQGTRLLRGNGIKVGFFGANPDQFI
jgi:hypothetical protein